MANPQIQSFSPNAFNPGAAISFNIFFNFNVIIEQFISAKLTCNSVNYSLVINSASGNSLLVSLSTGISSTVDCTLSAVHYNSATITTTLKVSIAPQSLNAYISSFSPACALINQFINFTINLSRTLDDNVNLVSAQLIDPAGAATSITIPSGSRVSPITATSNGVATANSYSIKLNESNGLSISSSDKINILARTPVIVLITPNVIVYDNNQVVFTVTFDVPMTGSYITGVTLVESTGFVVPLTITGISGNTLTVQTSGTFTPSSSNYFPRFVICNSVVVGRSFLIAHKNVTPVATNTNTDIPNCNDGEVYNSNLKKCIACDGSTPFSSAGACVEKCPADNFIFNDKVCVTNCRTAYNLVSLGNKCVSQCPSDYLQDSSGACVNCKALGQFYYERSCVKACPSGTTANAATLTCQVSIVLDQTKSKFYFFIFFRNSM
jgi:hypothetical protein